MARRSGVLALLLAAVVVAAAVLVVVVFGSVGAPGSPGSRGLPGTSPSIPATAAANDPATPRASVSGIRGSATAPAIDPESGLPAIRRSALPKAALLTLDLIEVGGPFQYAQDGSVYRNLERILPSRPSGYYHEYTVETPGSPDRGARRIVSGRPGELYWTADHYASFRRIVP